MKKFFTDGDNIEIRTSFGNKFCGIADIEKVRDGIYFISMADKNGVYNIPLTSIDYIKINEIKNGGMVK